MLGTSKLNRTRHIYRLLSISFGIVWMEKIVVYKLETDVSFLDFDPITKKKVLCGDITNSEKRELYKKNFL
nr:Uncharacterized protein A9P81_1280 [Leptospira interrogans serovar Copenhageni/Icterohaemorrhagiae]